MGAEALNSRQSVTQHSVLGEEQRKLGVKFPGHF